MPQLLVSVSGHGPLRALPLLGLGNELVWQSLNDSKLNAAILDVGGAIGRYPGGTPSDYWNWASGWASDVETLAKRAATPSQWSHYAEQVNSSSILVFNQLTANLSNGIQGLKAHDIAGTPISFVEMGNEMYDDSRSDVTSMYPKPADYGKKMANWTAAIATAFPSAKIAQIAMTWRPSMSDYQKVWNDQVFGSEGSPEPSSLRYTHAATLHPYFGISWHGQSAGCGAKGVGASGPWLATYDCSVDGPCCCQAHCDKLGGCKGWQYMTAASHRNRSGVRARAGDCYLKSSAAMEPNSVSFSGSPAPTPAVPIVHDIASVFAQAFKFTAQNRQMTSKLPQRLRLWVTEVAAYGAPELNFTWLETLVTLLFEVLLLRTSQVDIVTPYCIVCGDPIAPNFMTDAAQASPGTHSVIPPTEAGKVQWNQTIRSMAHRMLFRTVKQFLPTKSQMQQLNFEPNPPLVTGDSSSSAGTETYIGWRIACDANNTTQAAVLLNVGAKGAGLDLSHLMPPRGTSEWRYNCIWPESEGDLVRPMLLPHELQNNSGTTKSAANFTLPPYSVCRFS